MEANKDAQILKGRLSVDAGRGAGARHKAYFVHPAAPVCLDASEPEDRVAGVKKVHVYPANQSIGDNLKKLVGKTVRLRGSAFARHTRHHRAPIVMEVTEVVSP